MSEPVSDSPVAPTDDTGRASATPDDSSRGHTGPVPDLLEAAWSLIANAGWDAGSGDVDLPKTAGWHEAAVRWRDDYHRWLRGAVPVSGEAAIERYAEAAWKLRCERAVEAKERPSGIGPWRERAGFLREIDRSVASLVAAMAVHDAGLEAAAMRRQLLAFSIHMPALRRALAVAISGSDYEAEAGPYRAALRVLGGEESSP